MLRSTELVCMSCDFGFKLQSISPPQCGETPSPLLLAPQEETAAPPASALLPSPIKVEAPLLQIPLLALTAVVAFSELGAGVELNSMGTGKWWGVIALLPACSTACESEADAKSVDTEFVTLFPLLPDEKSSEPYTL